MRLKLSFSKKQIKNTLYAYTLLKKGAFKEVFLSRHRRNLLYLVASVYIIPQHIEKSTSLIFTNFRLYFKTKSILFGKYLIINLIKLVDI
jgi:hypothetical protein